METSTPRWVCRCLFSGLLSSSLLACQASQSTLEIRAYDSLSDPSALAGLEITIAERVITAADFTSNGSGVMAITVQVPNSGRLEAQVRLVHADQVVADGVFGWELEEDWEWGVGVFRTVENPAEMCFGCRGHAELPIAGPAAAAVGESLWLVWSGAPRGSDIVY